MTEIFYVCPIHLIKKNYILRVFFGHIRFSYFLIIFNLFKSYFMFIKMNFQRLFVSLSKMLEALNFEQLYSLKCNKRFNPF